MKLVKRNGLSNPLSSAVLWAIPTMSYTLQKIVGVEMNDREWLWWVTIPVMFTMWLALNFKTVPTRQNDAE